MIGSYTPWWVSYLLIHAATYGHDHPWWIFPAMVPVVVVAAVSCAVFDSNEKRIEHECRQMNRTREITASLERRLRAQQIQARVTLELPNDEEWAREVLRLLEIEDLSDCSAGAQHSDSDDEWTN